MSNVTEIQINTDLTKLSVLELVDLSDIVQSYLETHEPDQFRGCSVDVNDRPFDKMMYERQKQRWYSIWVEYFSRPVEEGLEIRL